MSFYASNPFQTGAPQELTLPGLRNPMLPQPIPGADAAGPKYLSGFGRIYAQQLRSQKPAGLRGFGDAASAQQAVADLFGTGVNAGMDYVWPELQTRMDAWLKPLKYAMYFGMGLTAVGTTFALLNYIQLSRRK